MTKTKSLKQLISAELSLRFRQSYGVWTELARFLDQLGLLQLQCLSKYMYKTAIPRVQIKWRPTSPFFYFRMTDITGQTAVYRPKSGG